MPSKQSKNLKATFHVFWLHFLVWCPDSIVLSEVEYVSRKTDFVQGGQHFLRLKLLAEESEQTNLCSTNALKTK